MNEKISKLLEELNKVLEEFIKENNGGENFKEAIEKAFKTETIISMKKSKDGTSKVHIAGNNLSILVSLAGLEKHILKSKNIPDSLWETIKHIVDVKEEK